MNGEHGRCCVLGILFIDIHTCCGDNYRAAGAFRKGGPQTEVGSSLSSDTYTYSSELVIIEALDGLCALGLGIQDCVCGCSIPWQEIKKIPRSRAPPASHRKSRCPSVTERKEIVCHSGDCVRQHCDGLPMVPTPCLGRPPALH